MENNQGKKKSRPTFDKWTDQDEHKLHDLNFSKN